MDKNSHKKPVPQRKDFDIRITSDGQWIHEGGLIKRQKLVALFATVLSCDDSGQHWLHTPVEFGTVEVEDAAFILTALREEEVAGEQVLIFTDNIEREYQLGEAYHLVIEADEKQQPKPYLSLDKGVWAKLSHPIYYQLADHAQTDTETGELGVYSGGMFFSLEKFSRRRNPPQQGSGRQDG